MMYSKFRHDEIHIAFNGDEIERVTDPIIKSKADKVYIFTFYKEWTDPETGEKKFQVDQNLDKYQEVKKQLESAGIEVVKNVPKSLQNIQDPMGNYLDGIPVSYHDYVEIMQKISEIIINERIKDKNVNISLNLAVGSKITAIAGLDCARFWNINVYYVIPEFWDQRKNMDEPLSSGKMVCISPPHFEMKRPSNKLIRALKVINDIFEENKKIINDNYKKIEKITGLELTDNELNTKNVLDYEPLYEQINKVKEGLSSNQKKIIDQLHQEIIVKLQENQMGVKKSKLLKHLRLAHLVSSNKYDNIPISSKLAGKELSTFYGAMNKQIIHPLKEWNLIKENDTHKNKSIQITEYGKLFLKIFKYILIYEDLNNKHINNYKKSNGV
ncbi:MAG: HFX_2341 family transcriptional regulator domain-containing protein [Candidatus Helarchaeota archaeon]